MVVLYRKEKCMDQSENPDHKIDEVISSVDSIDFEEKVHAVQLDITKMLKEFPTLDSVKVVVIAKGSSIKVAALEFLNKDGSNAEKVKTEKPEVV